MMNYLQKILQLQRIISHHLYNQSKMMISMIEQEIAQKNLNQSILMIVVSRLSASRLDFLKKKRRRKTILKRLLSISQLLTFPSKIKTQKVLMTSSLTNLDIKMKTLQNQFMSKIVNLFSTQQMLSLIINSGGQTQTFTKTLMLTNFLMT